MTDRIKSAYRKLLFRTLLAEAICWGVTISLYGSMHLFGGNGQLEFLYSAFFWLLLLIPLLLSIYLGRWKWKSALYERYRGMGKTRMLSVPFKPWRYFMQYFFLRNVFFFLILALAQPVMGYRKVKGSRRILDLVICLDISSSMNTVDMDGNARLTVAKRGISELLNNMRGERIAVVIFANKAYTQLPLTMDYGAAKLFVSEIETELISDQGTNIGAALEMAREQFRDSESGHAVLVITDGEDHEQLWQEQVNIYREKGIEISYYGIGSEKGGLIPEDPMDPSAGYKREDGSPVVSRLDREALSRMANETNSQLYFAESAYPDMSRVITALSSAKTKQIKNLELTVQANYFQIPLILAFLCLAGYLFVPFLVNRTQP